MGAKISLRVFQKNFVLFAVFAVKFRSSLEKNSSTIVEEFFSTPHSSHNGSRD